jgi:hypothetical protein
MIAGPWRYLNPGPPEYEGRPLCSVPPYMEHERSLPCSQEPALRPYPEPDEYNRFRLSVRKITSDYGYRLTFGTAALP